MGQNRGFENPYRNEEYIQSILQRFPEFIKKKNIEVINLLDQNIDSIERNYKYIILDKVSKQIEQVLENNIDIQNDKYTDLFESTAKSCIHYYDATVDYIDEEVWIVELNCKNSDWNFQKVVPIVIFSDLGHELKKEQTYNIKTLNIDNSVEVSVNLIKDIPIQKDFDELYKNKQYRGFKDSGIWRNQKK